MITNSVDGENRQTFYTNSSNIGSSNGCVFLDSFTKSLESNSSAVVENARSVIALNVYTSTGESLTLSIDSTNYIDDVADPRADKYFDDEENVANAIKEEYTKFKESGFITTELTDSEIAEMSEIFARVSSFSHYNQQDYYGENNLGRYKLSTGMVVDMVHQEMVVSSEYTAESGSSIPENWTDTTPISSLPGFEDFRNTGFDKVIQLPEESGLDDTDSTDGSGDSGSTDGGGNSDTGSVAVIDSKYYVENETIVKSMFRLILDNQENLGYGSQAEKDFKSLVIDFNTEIGGKDTVAEKKEYFDTVMPYIAELTDLVEEPGTAVNIFKSIDVIFDAAFTNADYSIVDSGSSEINSELYSLRGTIDYYLNKMNNLKDEMDTYNEENPLDAGSTEVDPVWEGMLDRMHGLITEFFSDYGPAGSEEFIDSKLEEVTDNSSGSDDSGPDEGLIGDIYSVIRDNPNGIPLDSAGQTELLNAVKEFQNTVFELKTSGYSLEKIKDEYDSALPYLNKAIGLLNDTDAAQYALETINNTFRLTFLEDNGSIPQEYDDVFRAEISEARGGMKQAVEGIDYYNGRIEEALKNNEPTAIIEQYTNEIYDLISDFVQATGVQSYEAALIEYQEEQN